MTYISRDGQVLQSKPWSLGSIGDLFFGLINVVTLFFSTLNPFSTPNSKGENHSTDYRSTGGRGAPPGGGPKRRFGGFGGGQGGPTGGAGGPPPMAGGG